MEADLETQLKREKTMHRMAYQHAARADADRAHAVADEADAMAEAARWRAKYAEMTAREAELLAILGLDPLTEWEEIVAVVKAMATERDDFLVLLHRCFVEMHPVFANTSFRGKGVGGQTMTPGCLVNDPHTEQELATHAEIQQTIGRHFGDIQRIVTERGKVDPFPTWD